MCDEKILISVLRLKELEELESKLPLLIETAVIEYKKKNLEKLRERDKANPAGVIARVKKYFEKNREEINKKMREKRKLKKENLKTVKTYKEPLLAKIDGIISDKIISDKIISDKIISDKIISDKMISDKIINDKVTVEKKDEDISTLNMFINEKHSSTESSYKNVRNVRNGLIISFN